MDRNNDGLNLDDNDRLPWLETADGNSAIANGSFMQGAFWAVGGLALLAAIVGGILLASTPTSGRRKWHRRTDCRAQGQL